MDNELFPIVDVNGNIIGSATRRECHSGSMILHPVVHLHIYRKDGSIFLQKRAMSKDIQPGKWDTAVGGHVDLGESVYMALAREAKEELGIEVNNPQFLCSYPFRSSVEYELVTLRLGDTVIVDGVEKTILRCRDNTGQKLHPHWYVEAR